MMTELWSADVQVLRPLFISQLVGAVGMVMVAVSAVFIGFGQTPVSIGLRLLVAAFAAVCIVLAVRGLRVRLELGADEIRVVGWAMNRRIPRRLVRAVSIGQKYPFLIWTDDSGRQRATILSAFSDRSSVIPTFRRHAAKNREALSAWIDAS
jgi:hypothetical protein